jgi:hypothetical protein
MDCSIDELVEYGKKILKLHYVDLNYGTFVLKMQEHFGDVEIKSINAAWKRTFEETNIIELFGFSELSVINEVKKVKDTKGKKCLS